MVGTFQIGEVVTLRPPCECPGLWRQLAEQLEEKTFQVTGTARTIGADVLVLQPWPGAEIYPSCRLAPAECLQLAPQEVCLICGKYWPVSVETVEAFHSIAETIALEYPNDPEMIADLRALATRWEQKLNASQEVG